VQSTRKITKAMELIAASQISRSQARIIANRPYRNGMRRIIVEAAKADPAGAAKLLATPEHVDCAIVLVLTGDRGLSGAYNSSAMRAGERLVRKLEDDGTSVRLSAWQEGRRLLSLPRDRPGRRFRRMSDRPTFEDARRIAATVAAPFVSGEAQQVLLVSTRFLSSATQSVEVEQLLPLAMPDLVDEEAPKVLKGYTEFEPEVAQLLTTLRAQGPRERDLLSTLRRRGLVSHQSTARHGRRDRQRRRTRTKPQSRHEPGPSGLDHDRNHGNRGRRRSAPLGKVRNK